MSMDYELMEALMDMVNQHCQDLRDPELVHDGALSSNEDAIFLLIERGFAEPRGKGYRLLWDKLKPYQTVSKKEPTP